MHTHPPLHCVGLCVPHFHMHTHPPAHCEVPMNNTRTCILTRLCTVWVSVSHTSTCILTHLYTVKSPGTTLPHAYSPASAPSMSLCPTRPHQTQTAPTRCGCSAGRSTPCRASMSQRSGHIAACRMETCGEKKTLKGFVVDA